MRTTRGQFSGQFQSLKCQCVPEIGHEGKSVVAEFSKKITYTDFVFVYVKIVGGGEGN